MRTIYRIALLSILLLIGIPFGVHAQEQVPPSFFKAKVLEVERQETIEDEYIGTYTEQVLRIQVLDGPITSSELTVENNVDILASEAHVYTVNDVVVVSGSEHIDGSTRYYIIDHARTTPLLWLGLLFVVAVLAIARRKGVRALLVLVGTALIVLKFIIPYIISGAHPLLITTFGALGIMALAVFVTEGINKKSKVSFLAIILSLVVVLLVSWFAVEIAKLSGAGADEALYIAGIQDVSINLKGLLLAGIIIGTLGVLDDIVVSQVSVVHELLAQNPKAKRKSIYDAAMRVGTDHIAAIINTLFLAYAGVGLPLLILFAVYENTNLTIEYIISGELMATEIVRTIAGSIALLCAMPIATLLAVHVFVPKENTEKTIDHTVRGHQH